jgi:hypothetical protein
MASSRPEHGVGERDKPVVYDVEDIDTKTGKPHVEMVDYAGAAKVVDPAELKLVRKLDRRIMVSRPLLPCGCPY